MPLRLAFLSTYPPTQCGLATFTKAKVRHLVGRDDVQIGVVSVVDTVHGNPPDVVVHQWEIGETGSVRGAVATLNDYDAVVVQHEYGIYGGRDGADVVDLLDLVRVPVITVLHTVLSDPTNHQHLVLNRVARRSTALVTMTETARERLLAGWPVDPKKVSVIPHGAEPNEAHPTDPPHGDRPVILTWGLIGPGKGIEWGIEALAALRDLSTPPLYRVVGETHPRVKEREGEAYRESLIARARELGVADLVEFDDSYQDHETLLRTVRSADLVLLPYDSREQVTSGVLTEAVVAGKPVISTQFPHARELLGEGAGILVPQGDPHAIAAALRRALTDAEVTATMAARARELASRLHWSAVTDEYVELARSLVAQRRMSVAAS